MGTLHLAHPILGVLHMTPGLDRSVNRHPGRLWSLLDMYEMKLKFFGTVMEMIRREELKYRARAINPPPQPPSKGLFGLGVGAAYSNASAVGSLFGFRPREKCLGSPARALALGRR